MENFDLRLSNILELIDADGVAGFDDSKVEELEALINECNTRQKGSEYANQVADSIYDTLYDMLKQVKPESGILSEIWEDDGDITEYTDLLVKHPMMSIETIKSYDSKELSDWVDSMPDETGYFASFKINGHGIRVVYKDGYLVSATSRARSSAGRDLTEHMKIILGDYNEELADYGLVELRGEVCLKLDKLEQAREFNPAIKSAFSAVSSLIRPSATQEEVELLDFLCYGFLKDDFFFEDREEEFQMISACGFKTPEYLLIESCSKYDLMETIHSIVETFEEAYDEFGYFCDGVVLEVNNRDLFSELGTEGNHNKGNIALKVGLWKQDLYSGYVQKIIWTKGKSKLSPVAIVADEPYKALFDYDGNIVNMEDMGVLTAQGNSVKRVPLYEPKNIMILDAYEDELLCFRYGGEAGVVPCFPDGRTLNEDAAMNILVGEEWLEDL
jgi:DNA ligase (NAD+)